MPGKSFDVVIKVVSQQGKCRRKHFVGQQWRISSTSPGGICMSALTSMMPIIAAVRYSDGALPWTKEDADTDYVDCPDYKNPVAFELKRIRA